MIGYELEFSMPKFKEASKSIKKAIPRIQCLERYKKSKGRHWELKLDSSTAIEIASPKFKIANLNKFTHWLTKLDLDEYIATEDDGFHVHVDALIKEENIGELIKKWMLIEPAVFNCFPYYRYKRSRSYYPGYGYRTHDYCDRFTSFKSNIITEEKIEENKDKISAHHSVLNIRPKNSKTQIIEIRIAEGTSDIKMIRNWIKFCNHFATVYLNLKIDAEKPFTDVFTLIEIMRIRNKDLKKWLTNRYFKYKRN